MKPTMPEMEQTLAPGQPHQVAPEPPFLKTNRNETVTGNLKSWLQPITTKKPLAWRRLNALNQTTPNPPPPQREEEKCQPTAQIVGKTVNMGHILSGQYLDAPMCLCSVPWRTAVHKDKTHLLRSSPCSLLPAFLCDVFKSYSPQSK